MIDSRFLSVLVLVPAMAQAEPRISDKCFIDPRQAIKHLYGDIHTLVPILADHDVLASSLDAYTVEYMLLDGKYAAIMSWKRQGDLVHYFDMGFDGVVDYVHVNGQSSRVDFNAESDACHVLEQIVENDSTWALISR